MDIATRNFRLLIWILLKNFVFKITYLKRNESLKLSEASSTLFSWQCIPYIIGVIMDRSLMGKFKRGLLSSVTGLIFF